MSKKSSFLFLFFAILTFISCNPECENFARVDAVIMPKFDMANKSFLLTTSPANFLADRQLYGEKLINNELVVSESTKIEVTPFEGGYLIRFADLEEGNFNFYVRDNDCGGFIPFNTQYVCESVSAVQVEITPSVREPGDQVLITTSPANFLEGKQLYIQNTANENVPLSTTFLPGQGGVIATLPNNTTGNLNISISDDNCGGFTSLNRVRVADQAYKNNNPGLFVTPTPPTIIIPPPTIPPPTNIVNTWFSPDNRDYCIWFLPDMERIVVDGQICFREKSNLLPGKDVGELVRVALATNEIEVSPETVDLASIGSWELSAPFCADPSEAANYSANPVSGIIDYETGYVNFVIDRTSKNLGLEHYEGSIVQTSTLPEYAQLATNPAACSADAGAKSETIMLVTSAETGKQMILFRQRVIGIAEDRICN